MRHRFRSALVGLALAPALAVSAPPAQASPTPAPPPVTQQVPEPKTEAGYKSETAKASRSETALIKRLRKTTDAAHVDGDGRIDWNWVEQTLPSKNERNAFGAGWYSRRGDWKQFTHLSTNDRKGIIDWARDHEGPDPEPEVAARPKPCLGYTGEVADAVAKTWTMYLNSCDTRTVIAWNTAGIPAYAAFSAILLLVSGGGWTVPAVVGTAFISGHLAWLVWAQQSSDIEATIIRTRFNITTTSNGYYRSLYWIYPQ